MEKYIIEIITTHTIYREIEAETLGEAFEMARRGDGREKANAHAVVGYNWAKDIPKEAYRCG